MTKCKPSSVRIACRLAAVLLWAATALGLSTLAGQAQTPAYLATFPHFEPALTSPFPGDVDTALKRQLEAKKEFAAVQRLFDLDAWQMFLAVNWPTNDQGQPAPSFTDTSFGPPHWTLWQTSSQVFRTDGQRPAACGAASSLAALQAAQRAPALLLPGLPLMRRPPGVNPRSVLLLGNLSAVGNISVLDLKKGGETNQAFSGPLVDQNGNLVHYEIAIDPNELQYVCQTGIYNINGQIAFSKGNPRPSLQFPAGSDARDWSGATELKFAWKIIDQAKGDQPGRFFTMKAIIPTADGGTRQVLVGLVGMHIAHKSQSSPQWIWATFEQVDNLVGDPLAHPPVKPSFYNPDQEIAVPDLDPALTGDTPTPTQVMRGIPIPGDKIALNAEAEAVLRGLKSVWQYYQLVDTQWPTDPSAKPTPWNVGLPGAIDNKSGGDPTPVFLTNITMETYFQRGTQPACQQEELPAGVPCPPAPQFPQKSDGTPVFATESCMGCHSSAGVITAYDPNTKTKTTAGQLSGDFSWLPEQKASYLPPTP